MRHIIDLNSSWFFHKGKIDRQKRDEVSKWEQVTLPHTWNAHDGQDGGNDYYQGESWYYREITAKPAQGPVYLKIGAANKMAKVWCNDIYLGEHRGGFSSFVFDPTKALVPGVNKLFIMVDNSASLPIYPMMADFTFFGGLYRGAELLCFDSENHFDVATYGTDALFVTPKEGGRVKAEAQCQGNGSIRFSVFDQTGALVAESVSMNADAGIDRVEAEILVNDIHLWEGLKNPYLYTMKASMMGPAGEVYDEISTSFGFRSFKVDSQTGFYLNGKSYPLHGVCRHQDREDKGWAIGEKEHREDLQLILDMGANTVRLAHYEQASFFYDLCDQAGLVVWAEIPFISAYDPREEADENLYSQMRELVCQNYNHPSICFWGVANEIGIGGESERMYAVVRKLNAMTKQMDPTRLTVIANVGMTKPDSPLFHSTDLTSYNEYQGWYEGKYTEHGVFCDNAHNQIPDVPLAISEYGADCLTKWHSEEPKVKDYTEEYQALLHEHAEADFAARPYLWATWLWNMFDFAADARDEGGCRGRNNKGLVTYDRKVKKQAYYYYKARWSRDPFVYLCGKRFIKHAAEKVSVKVYSNCGEVELLVNGKSLGSKTGNAVFVFENVTLQDGENTLTVRTKDGLTDTCQWEKVDVFPAAYVFVEEKQVSNTVAQWFAQMAGSGESRKGEEISVVPGYYSVYDIVDDIFRSEEGKRVILELVAEPLKASNSPMADRMAKGGGLSFFSVWNHIQKLLPDDLLYVVNDRLNQIPKTL